MLESLGLDPLTERVYRGMLAHPNDGVSRLAARLHVDEDKVRSGLDTLHALALVRPSDFTTTGFHTVGPEAAMELLLARQKAELAAQQLRLEAARVAAAQLIAECSGPPSHEMSTDLQRVEGAEAIRDQLSLLGKTAESEVMTLVPGNTHCAELELSRGPHSELLDRGVRIRTVYLDSVRNHQLALGHVAWLDGKGAEVRTAPTLPVRMIIVDRRQAVLPTDPEDAEAGAVALTGSGVLAALCALFETVWEKSVPVNEPTPADSHGLSRLEAANLRLLAEGLTDQAIASRLGVSPRTTRRMASDLMDRLEARSRFQAGVHAVRMDWLPRSPDTAVPTH